MKKKICQYLSKVLVEISEEELMKTMEIPPEEKMGDLALPCFVMAKKMRKNPMLIATELVERLNEQKEELGIENSIIEALKEKNGIKLKDRVYLNMAEKFEWPEQNKTKKYDKIKIDLHLIKLRCFFWEVEDGYN